jgi:glycosyltransferase involved in cell wall biosynthesis
MKKLITVIIPCYNHGAFIDDAIASVINNDFENICEIIVVNDGSTDQLTIDTLNSLEGETILVYHQENLGLAKARNKGIELATTEYLLMLDADNKINRDFLIEFKSLFSKNDSFDMLHGNAMYFGERDGIMHSKPLNFFGICKQNYIDACAIIKRETLIDLGMYDAKMPCMGWEDWDLWIRMAFKNKKTIYCNRIFFEYRYAQNSMIRTIGHKENETREYLKLKYNNLLDKNFQINLLDNYFQERLIGNTSIKLLIQVIFKKLQNKIYQKKN